MWALRQESLDALDQRLTELRPKVIVEAGSGESTAVMAKHGHVISLEHLGRYARASQRLALTADVRLCPLTVLETPAGPFPWYDTQLPDGIDFALIDGPPGHIGRQAALFALWPHLAPGWEVWLDDVDRAHEKDCLSIWAEFFRFTVEPVSESMARLCPL